MQIEASPRVSPMGAALPAPSLPRYRVDPLWGAILVSIIVGISRIHQHFGPLMVIRPAMLSFLVAVGYALLVPSSIRPANLRESWTVKVMAVFSICAILSIPFGISLGGAATFLMNGFASTLIYTFLTVTAVRNWRDLRFLVLAFLVADALLLWLCLFVFKSELAASGINRLAFSYSYDGNDVGVILMMGVPMAVFMLYSAKGLGRLFYLTILACTIITLALTGSRGGMVGLVAVSVALFVVARDIKLTHRLGLVGMFVALLVVAAPAGYWKQMQTILNPKDDYNVTSEYGRVEIFKRGLEYIWQYPLFGVGLNNFGRAESTISSRAKHLQPGEQLMWAAPHNTQLQVAAEMGLIAFAMWLAVIVGGTVGLLRWRRRLPASWRHGDDEQRFLYQMTTYLPVSFVGFFVTAAFVSWAYLQAFYLLFVMLAGLHVLLVRRLPRNPGPDPARGTRYWRVRRFDLRDAVALPSQRSETLG